MVVLLMHDLCQKVAGRWVCPAKWRCDEIILSPYASSPVEPGQEFHWIRGFLLSQNVDKCAMSQWLPLTSWFIIIPPSTPQQKPKKRQLSFFQLQMLILN
uniref:Nervous system abundant protein 11 n=1 Tax=Homo sapiens TaxID=9606 RepID=Q86YR2_HUMAN|nr:nervous system abundant protein 11 [Homo sapiens]